MKKKDELNNIIIVLEKIGKILKIFHKNCNCYNQFIPYVKKLMETTGNEKYL